MRAVRMLREERNHSIIEKIELEIGGHGDSSLKFVKLEPIKKFWFRKFLKNSGRRANTDKGYKNLSARNDIYLKSRVVLENLS